MNRLLFCCSSDAESRKILYEIVQSFSDTGSRVDALLHQCEMDISRAIDEIKGESSSCSDSEMSDEDGRDSEGGDLKSP